MQLQRVAGKLRHDETKTDDSTRKVALPQPCIRALRRHRAQQAADRLGAGDRWTDSDLAFTTRKGTPIEPRNINRTFDALVKRAGVQRIRFHDLRHSCATLLFAQGVDLQTIRDLLGHSSRSTSTCSGRCSAMGSTVSDTCSDRTTSPTHDH